MSLFQSEQANEYKAPATSGRVVPLQSAYRIRIQMSVSLTIGASHPPIPNSARSGPHFVCKRASKRHSNVNVTLTRLGHNDDELFKDPFR